MINEQLAAEAAVAKIVAECGRSNCGAYASWGSDGALLRGVGCRMPSCRMTVVRAAEAAGEPSRTLPTSAELLSLHGEGIVEDLPGYKAGFEAGIAQAAMLHASLAAKYRAVDNGPDASYHMSWARRIRELVP